MSHRFSLVAGSVVFAVLLIRVAPAEAAPTDAALLRGAAAAGVLLGAGLTAIALRFRRPVGFVHLAVLSPSLFVLATAIFIEQTPISGPGTAAIRTGMETIRTVVGGDRFTFEHAVVFAAAFWVLAAFFIHATALGYPRVAAGPALAAALAVAVLERGAASLPRIIMDLGLVTGIMVAASLDELRRPFPRFRPVGSRPRRRSNTTWPRVLAFSVVAAIAAGAVAVSMGNVVAERTFEPRSALPGNTVEYDPFVDLFSRLEQPTDTPLFTAAVSGADPATTYFVLSRLTVATGNGFTSGAGDAATLGTGPTIIQQVAIDRLRGASLPSVSGTLTSSAGTVDGGTLRGAPVAGLRYEVQSTGPIIPGVRNPASVAPPHPITTIAAGVDPAIVEEAQRVVAEAGATTPLHQGAALETFLRGPTFTYSVNRNAPDLRTWLLDPTADGYRSGYCEQYALSMATMARALGIPSRVVIGTAPGSLRPDGTVVVLDRNAHAWVELWIEGWGWVTFDPTPRRDGVALTPTAPRLADRILEPPRARTAVPDALRIPTEPIEETAEPSPPRWALIGLAAVAAGTLLLGTMLIQHRRRRATARRGDVAAAWEEIVTRLVELGNPPNPALTPLELAEHTDGAMVPLARAYTKSTYSGGMLSEAEVRVAQDSLQRTDATVTARTPRWRRMAAGLGLARLTGRRRLG